LGITTHGKIHYDKIRAFTNLRWALP